MNPEITEITSARPVKPWQRIAASLFATGMPVNDITVQVGQPVPAISSFLTSQEGRDILNSLLVENKARVDQLLDAAAIDSLLVLISIRDAVGPPAPRIAACREILSKTLPGVKARDVKPSGQSSAHQSPEDEIADLRKKVGEV